MSEEKTECKWTIRPCTRRDLDAVRAICEETSSLPLRNEKDRQFLLLTFCDAYVLYAKDCFVAVDAADRPVGYILCAADTKGFFRAFRKNVLPRITRLGPKYGVMARGVCLQKLFCAFFAPAHLHIDLTASVRRMGVGTALMQTLKARLASQGIARVELTVSPKNVSAIRFYEKNGFRKRLTVFGSYLMLAGTDR